MIAVRDLTLAYGHSPPVLSGVSAEFGARAMVSLIGANGSGKTTMLHAIAGLHPPLGGTVEVNDRQLYGRGALSRRRRAGEIAVVLSRDTTPGHLRVWEVVALGCEARDRALGRSTTEHSTTIDHALDLCGATSIRARRIGQLSDGERRRVMIARALAQEPTVLVLDEPTAHLDPPHQTSIFRILHDLVQNGRVGLVLLATHQLHLALHFSDQILLFVPEKTGVRVVQELPERVRESATIDSIYPDTGDLSFDRTRGWFVPRE